MTMISFFLGTIKSDDETFRSRTSAVTLPVNNYKQSKKTTVTITLLDFKRKFILNYLLELIT